MMLKIEDLKVGDRLECIDIDLYLDLDDEWKKPRLKIIESSLIVDRIYDGSGLSIKDCELCVPVSDFKYFKKKEQYTFDDLIDVANDAVKNKLITQTRFSLSAIDTPLLIVVYFDGREGRYTDDNFLNGIEFIKSLYKETFVIECEEDMKRIKDTAQITMSNKEILDYKDAISLEHYTNSFILKLLKGATVTQSK